MRREFFLWVRLIAGVVLLAGCSGGGGIPIREILGGGTGSVVVLGSDSPRCDVISFRVTVTGVTLTPQDGGTPVSVVSSAQAATLDFAALLDFSTVIGLAEVPDGTYTQASISLANPRLTHVDYSLTPPAPRTVAPTLETLTFTINIDPALRVTAGQTTALELDLDLLRSVLTDATGQITGVVNPVIHLRPVEVSPQGRLRELDGLHGLVRSVSSTAAGGFAGSFTLEMLGGRGPTLTVNVTSGTVFDGIAQLQSLLPGTFVDADAYVDAHGNIVAEVVEVEEQGDPAQGRAAFLGIITSVTRDAPPHANQFTLVVREEYPDVSPSIPLDSQVIVKILPTTIFKTTADDVNQPGLPFDAAGVGAGQEVVVHGDFQPVTPEVPGIVNASSIYVRLQSLVGNFAALLKAGSDGKTGGFSLTPCGSVFGDQPVTALTFSQTEFVNVADLRDPSLTPATLLVVRGLLLYSQSAGAFGGVSWSPPAWIAAARTVRQLPQEP